MNILAIGDIVAKCGVEHTAFVLRSIKQEYDVDFVVANAENASGAGISFNDYEVLSDAGVDFFTLGNHSFGKADVIKLMEQNSNIIRPVNYPKNTPGAGYAITKAGDVRIAIINAMGRVNMGLSLDCPFEAVSKAIDEVSRGADIVLLDFHAETTSEKRTMMFYTDGKLSAMWGTHTHVQTADEMVTRRGMAYITDLGMTGCEESVLGVDKDIIIRRYTEGVPSRFSYPMGRASLCGALFSIDEKSGKAISAKRIRVR